MNDESTSELALRLRALEGEARVLRARLKRELHPTIVPKGHFATLLCEIGDSTCGILVAEVEQVVPIMWLEPLPESPPWVAGTFNLAGVTVPTIDILTRWDRRTGSVSLEERVVVVKVDGRSYGLVVQGVIGARTFRGADVEPSSEDLPVADYVLGVLGEGHLLLLDTAELVRHTGLTRLSI